MSHATLHWTSPVLRRSVPMTVILPDNAPRPWPVLYLLHGMWDDHNAWMLKARAMHHCRKWPICVVMPDGQDSFYTNHNNGEDYFAHFAEALPSFIEQTFPVRTDCGGRCVGGLSMGGYGALRLALGRPDRYASAHSHSGATMIGSREHKELSSLTDEAFRRIFGPDPRGSHHDLGHLAEHADPRPALRIDCGVDDFLFEDNQKFHTRLNQLGFDHQYETFPGGHSWDYWDEHLPEALPFHAGVLGLEPIEL